MKRYISAERIEQMRGLVADRPHLPQSKDLRLLRWERMDRAVHEHGALLRRLELDSTRREGPALSVHARGLAPGGADIDHVLVSLRDLDAAMKSKVAAGYEEERVELRAPELARVRNRGYSLTPILTHDVAYSLVRFPDFLKEPEALYEAMRFPGPVEQAAFLEAFERIAHPDMVHH